MKWQPKSEGFGAVFFDVFSAASSQSSPCTRTLRVSVVSNSKCINVICTLIPLDLFQARVNKHYRCIKKPLDLQKTRSEILNSYGHSKERHRGAANFASAVISLLLSPSQKDSGNAAAHSIERISPDRKAAAYFINTPPPPPQVQLFFSKFGTTIFMRQ